VAESEQQIKAADLRVEQAEGLVKEALLEKQAEAEGRKGEAEDALKAARQEAAEALALKKESEEQVGGARGGQGGALFVVVCVCVCRVFVCVFVCVCVRIWSRTLLRSLFPFVPREGIKSAGNWIAVVSLDVSFAARR